MRLFAGPLGCTQVAFMDGPMPQHTGGKGSYRHRHRTQEEISYVISGRLGFKLDDEVIAVGNGGAVRVARDVVRAVWNAEPSEAEILICSVKIDDPSGDVEAVTDFWRADL